MEAQINLSSISDHLGRSRRSWKQYAGCLNTERHLTSLVYSLFRVRPSRGCIASSPTQTLSRNLRLTTSWHRICANISLPENVAKTIARRLGNGSASVPCGVRSRGVERSGKAASYLIHTRVPAILTALTGGIVIVDIRPKGARRDRLRSVTATMPHLFDLRCIHHAVSSSFQRLVMKHAILSKYPLSSCEVGATVANR